jgi:hypothetical protein
MKIMTNRERMLALIRGEEHDRVPFVQYDDCAAPNTEIWPVIGRNSMGLLRWSSTHRFERPNCKLTTEPLTIDGLRGERNTIVTPAGTIYEERKFEPTYGGPAWRKHYLETPEDYRIFLTYLRDTVVLDDSARAWKDAIELGDDGWPLVAVQRTPYQQLWIEWVGLQAFSLHMVDYPELIAEVMQELASLERKVFRVVCQAIDNGAPIPLVDVPDNVTAPVLGVRNFGTYCVPLYQELAEMLDKRNVPVFVHMDGDLKPFWQLIGESGVKGLDSFSPAPENDTSPAQANAMWPWMRLGMNFPSSIHIARPETIYATAWDILQQVGHTGRLQIQISENVPPGVWKVSYPQIVRAIHDFGRP